MKGIPQLYEKLRGNFYSMMAQLFTDIQSDKKLPPLIVEAIKRSALQLKLKFSVVLSKMGKILQDVQNKAREIRNMDEKILLQKLRPIFEFAYAIKGEPQKFTAFLRVKVLALLMVLDHFAWAGITRTVLTL